LLRLLQVHLFITQVVAVAQVAELLLVEQVEMVVAEQVKYTLLVDKMEQQTQVAVVEVVML
jgi:hypothetical protein